MFTLLFVKKSGFNFQSVAWPGLVPPGTSETSQNINIMRYTQLCFYVGSKISQLSYDDEIILIMTAYEFICFYDFFAGRIFRSNEGRFIDVCTAAA